MGHGTEAPLLVAERLVKDYGATRALDGASLHVYAGEVPALLGSSGSGKSTLLHCLAGIVAPDAGRVGHAGQDLAAMPDARPGELRNSPSPWPTRRTPTWCSAARPSTT